MAATSQPLPSSQPNPSPPSSLPLPLLFPPPQAKEELVERIQDYLEQKIRFADRMLVKHAIEKIQARC